MHGNLSWHIERKHQYFHASWEVLRAFLCFFRSLKLLENKFGFEKFWKLKLKILANENHGQLMNSPGVYNKQHTSIACNTSVALTYCLDKFQSNFAVVFSCYSRVARDQTPVHLVISATLGLVSLLHCHVNVGHCDKPRSSCTYQ